MSATVEELLAEARKLPAEAQRRLVSALLADTESGEEGAGVRAALAIVEETRGTIQGLDRETVITLAEDEEFSGH